MDLLLLPDFLAMCLLVAVLFAVRGQDRNEFMQLCTAALLLILLECASLFVYGARTGLLVHRLAHGVALEAYLFAGALFLRSASSARRRLQRSRLFLALNVVPHAVLMAIYSADVRSPLAYYPVIAMGLVLGVVVSLWLRRPRYYLSIFALLWLPMAVFAHFRLIHFIPYFALSMLYLLSGIAFTESLPKASRGMIAVTFGFTMWSLCFLLHPWIADYHRAWVPLAGRVWDMQKFIITVGFLLVLLEQQIRDNEWLALHDELTGLPNRRLFDDRLSSALTRADRDHRGAALFTLDLDGFKATNDTYGHDAGDLLLQHVARMLQGVLRKSDTLARLGGDEFALIAVDLGAGLDADVGSMEANEAPSSHFATTDRIVAAICSALEQPFDLGAEHSHARLCVSASIGIALYPIDGTDVATLFRVADQRMYRQKAVRDVSDTGRLTASLV